MISVRLNSYANRSVDEYKVSCTVFNVTIWMRLYKNYYRYRSESYYSYAITYQPNPNPNTFITLKSPNIPVDIHEPYTPTDSLLMADSETSFIFIILWNLCEVARVAVASSSTRRFGTL